jgi:hypothetical protein
MPLICPDCRHPTLSVTRSIELGPMPLWDELSLQVVRCDRCQLTAIAVYEESRRGAPDQEIIHHTGYRLEKNQVAALDALIASCPRPDDHRCDCPAHQRLKRTDPRTGSWAGVARLGWLDDFQLEWIK